MKRLILSAFLALCGCIAFSQTLGEIRVFAGNYAPSGWVICDGSPLSTTAYSSLYTLLGTTFGGNGSTTFALPDLRQKVAIGAGQGNGLSAYNIGKTGGETNTTLSSNNLPQHTHAMAIPVTQSAGNQDTPAGGYPAITTGNTYATSSNSSMATNSISGTLTSAGGTTSISNMQPYLTINYIICTMGLYNSFDWPILGEIRLLAYNSTLPSGYLPCDGRTLNISAYQALYSLIGAKFGGNGTSTFALPDLRSRIPIGFNSNGTYPVGKTGGTETETLTVNNLPSHSHTATATTSVYSGIGNADSPVGNYPAINPQRGNEFSSASTSTITGTTNATGNASPTPVNNMQPYCTIQYVICTEGIYPTKSN
jgi:microcystin-dependent protein